MKKYLILIACFLLLPGVMRPFNPLHALEPTAEEMAMKKEWMEARFDGIVPEKAPVPGLEVIQNHDPLQLNTRNGQKLKIQNTEYEHGIYAHAPSSVKVTLPAPGKRLTGFVGIDTNVGEGRGSVQFSVVIGNQKPFETDILTCGNDPVPLDINLNGTTEFFLNVSDGGDHISFDQSNWAELTAELEDGSSLRIGDLPISAPDRTCEPQLPFSFVYDGQESSTFLANWKREVKTEDQKDGRTFKTISFLEPDGNLQVD